MGHANSLRNLAIIAICITMNAGFLPASAQDSFLNANSSVPQPPPVADLPSTPTPALQPVQPAERAGDLMMIQRRYQAAIEAYRRIPEPSAAVWNRLGIAYQMLYNFKQASRCYQESLRLKPDDPKVLNNMGTVFDAQERYADAERMYRKSILADPQTALVYKNLGAVLLAQRNFKEGAKAYQTALSLDPHIFQEGNRLSVRNPRTTRDRGAMSYFAAISCARAGLNSCAIDNLRLAFNEGFANPRSVESGDDFTALRNLPEFRQLLAEQQQPR